MYKDEELKLVYNTKTGRRIKVGPNIWNNPFRMRSGNWKIIEEPKQSCTGCAAVSVNMPEAKKSEPVVTVEIPSDDIQRVTVTEQDEFSQSVGTEIPSYEIPEVVTQPEVTDETERKNTQIIKNKQAQKTKNTRK